MKKTGVFPTFTLSIFLILLIFFAGSPLFGQDNDPPKNRFRKYPFTLSWVALDYAGWYIVEIQTAKGKSLETVQTTQPFYVFNAFPGQYQLKISVYNKLGTLEAASDWRSFSVVLPAREVKEVKKEEKVVKPRNYLILTHLEGMATLGDIGLDRNFYWGFSTLGTIAYTDFEVKGKSYKNWTFGNHLYFSGKLANEDSFMDFVGNVSITGFTGYKLIANPRFSCLPFAEIGLSLPILLENKDQGLYNNHVSMGFLAGFGATFMLSFNKFFFSTTLAYSLNFYFYDGSGSGLENFSWNKIDLTTENGFNFTVGCGLLF